MIRSDKQFGFLITTERKVWWQLCSSTGWEFQVDGPATAKLRGPYRSVLVAGTARSPNTAEHRWLVTTSSVISDRLVHGRQIAGWQVMHCRQLNTCNWLIIHYCTYRYRDIDAFRWKIACFPIPPLFDAPSGRTPCDINVIYTPLESTFTGLQFIGSNFIRSDVFAFQNLEIVQNSEKIYLIAITGHPRSSILVSIESS